MDFIGKYYDEGVIYSKLPSLYSYNVVTEFEYDALYENIMRGNSKYDTVMRPFYDGEGRKKKNIKTCNTKTKQSLKILI